MASTTSAFFARLAEIGTAPVLGSTRGRVRVDITDDPPQSWLVGIDRGTVTVDEGDGAADCVIRSSRATFDELSSGRTGALAATLRGALEVEGDPRLLVHFQRLFPAPTGMPAAAGARSTGKRRG